MALKFAVNNSLSAITTLPSSISGGALNLISTQTASASASLEFSMDSTYDSYVFKFYNIHPQNDANTFHFQASTDGGSNYGITLTSTLIRAFHNEADTQTGLDYLTDSDLAQSTSYQPLVGRPSDLGNVAYESLSGYLHLFNPSDTTFVKHFMSVANSTFTDSEATANLYMAGYGNTTSAINAIRFQMSSGNIDSGVIKLYGVS